MTLVLIDSPTFDVELSLAYATDRNFTGNIIYKEASCYLHEDAAVCLEKAIELANALGLRLKIFDAFRPREAQTAMWNHTPDPNFLSNPETGAIPHCRGVAIDLTLIDQSGKELEMGTGFDDFTPLSHHGSTAISVEAQHNRFVLLGIMTAAGWDFYRNEWWHYQMFNPREYSIYNAHDVSPAMM